jgi:hypothetical protein
MFNLGHNYVISFTVKDGYKRYNETETHGYTTVSFVEGEGYPNLLLAYHPIALPSGLLSM